MYHSRADNRNVIGLYYSCSIYPGAMVNPPGNGKYSIRLPDIWSVRTPDESRMSIGVCRIKQ